MKGFYVLQKVTLCDTVIPFKYISTFQNNLLHSSFDKSDPIRNEKTYIFLTEILVTRYRYKRFYCILMVKLQISFAILESDECNHWLFISRSLNFCSVCSQVGNVFVSAHSES